VILRSGAGRIQNVAVGVVPDRPYSTQVIRHVGQVVPSSAVPHTKQNERGVGTIGAGPSGRGAGSGNGGGAVGVRGGVASGGAAGAGVASGAGGGVTSGLGAGAGEFEGAEPPSSGTGEAGGLAGFGAGVGVGAAGFLGAGSSSRFRRRKNDIRAVSTERPILGVSAHASAPFSPAAAPGAVAPTPSERLRAAGIELPPPPKPAGAYVPVVVHDKLAWVSGQIATENGEVLHPGHVDRDIPIEVAKELARKCSLQALSALQAALGSIDRVRRFYRVAVYVAISPGFKSPHEVANGATEILAEIFGQEGKPARVALGVAGLPLNAPVEAEYFLSTW
jgi:enamine deaminase RidA (YjgF/YER057c/UK114 family)